MKCDFKGLSMNDSPEPPVQKPALETRGAAALDDADVTIRQWQKEDIPHIVDCEKAAYPEFPESELCTERHYQMQFETFPDGQFLAEIQGKVVGFATSLIVLLDDDIWYAYDEITGADTFNTHDPSGDTLYGADIAVHPDYRGRGIARMLYVERKHLMRRYNLRRMVAGGRIPGYIKHAGRLTPEEYVEAVKVGELKDPALNAHLKAGYDVRAVHMDYLPDSASLNYATFLEMQNPDYRPEKRQIASMPIRKPVRVVRICAAQYQMRRLRSWEDFEDQVEFFAATADEYHSHFLMFPEWFTCQLFSLLPREEAQREPMKTLTQYTDRYLNLFSTLSARHALHIVAGTHPIEREGKMYNVAHLFTPSGRVFTQDKLHITPDERVSYGITPGEELRVFDTGLARIAIQVCYDIEFPEASRLLTLAGAQVIFVPFATDERKAYLRVRVCAQARAVENWVYTAISGNIGNLPGVPSFLLNYGQSAVFTPSDFAFPPHGVAAEADPNVETLVIADLDLATLTAQRELGSVRPLRDRRPDLYELHAQHRIEIIRTY